MADTHDFAGSTHHFGPPPGLEEMVGWLHVFANGATVVSAWKPTAEELAALNRGESIFVSVMSGSQKLFDADGKVIHFNPYVFPMYVGTEEDVKSVASDTGKVW